MRSNSHHAARSGWRILVTGVLLMMLLAAPAAGAQEVPVATTSASGDSAAVAAVVVRYHEALERGDSAAALELLASDAVVLESGGSETREEYRSHHLSSDIAFAGAARTERAPIRVTVRRDVAWATSTSTTRGEFRGRSIDSVGAELMVLTRESDGWKIRAIHWSSRAKRPTQ